MILYDKKLEMIAYISDPIYDAKLNKKGQVIEHCFSARIDFEYKENPDDPKTGQKVKRTFWPARNRYPANSTTTKQNAEGFFLQELKRICDGNLIEIDSTQANNIQNAW